MMTSRPPELVNDRKWEGVHLTMHCNDRSTQADASSGLRAPLTISGEFSIDLAHARLHSRIAYFSRNIGPFGIAAFNEIRYINFEVFLTPQLPLLPASTRKFLREARRSSCEGGRLYHSGSPSAIMDSTRQRIRS
jgi:hypothetical protein